MLSRYPHTATLEVVKENDPMSGITKTTSVSFEIKGRFQPAASKSNRIDYKAKYSR